MKKPFKKSLKIFLIILGIIMVVPYFIPTDFENEIPTMPFDNSSFYTTEDEIILHRQIYKPDEKEIGKILMIHGLGASSYSFSNNAPVLEENGYFVVSVDLPAFGFSSKDKGIDHSQIENAKRLWLMLDALDTDLDSNEPWTIVGHSMGGSTSLAMANQYPERISSLILFSPAITQRPNRFSWVFRSPIGKWLMVFLRYNIITENNIRNILESLYSVQPSREDIENYVTPLQTTTTPQALLDFVVSSRNVVIDELIPQDITIHLIWGENDTVVPPEQIQIIETQYTISSITMIKEEGHLAHEKDPTINQILLDILNEQP